MDARGCGHDPDAGGVLSMKVESVSVDEISPDPANARMHDRRNLDAIAGSLRKWGQQKPIVISEAGVIVAGNGTWEAAKQIGWKRINAVKTKLEGSEAVAYGIADNRTAELAGWDDAVLGKHLEALQADESIDHLAAGFSDEEIKGLLAGLNGQDEVVEDEIPEPPAEPVTKAGELITLGDHRLLCGDSTNADNVARLMDGEAVGSVVTDPPYGMGFQSNHRRTKHKPIEGDNTGRLLAHATAIEADHSVYVWCRWDNIRLIPKPNSLVTWVKNNWSMGDLEHEHARQTEVCAFYPGESHAWTNGRPTDAIMFDRAVPDLHPTQKPVLLIAEVVRWTAGLVFDPFLGSGTTLIAAEQLGRKCYGLEIDPAYCDIIVQRWENLTRQKVQREMAMEAVV